MSAVGKNPTRIRVMLIGRNVVSFLYFYCPGIGRLRFPAREKPPIPLRKRGGETMRLTMDRRRFAALAGTAAASGAILGLAACSNPDAQSDKTAFSDTGDGAIPEVEKNGKWVNSSCQGCTSWCSVRVYVEDGRAVKVSGNPNSLSNRGFICPRPHLALERVR